VPRYRTAPASLRQLAIAHAGQIQPVTWRQGTKATSGNPTAAMTSHFLAVRVRPASRRIPRAPDGSLPECWLLAEWPPYADEPTDYWLSDLPEDTPDRRPRPAGQDPLAGRARLPRAQTRPRPGPLRGPAPLGWHRHVTLAALAQAFCTMLRTDPKAPAPG